MDALTPQQARERLREVAQGRRLRRRDLDPAAARERLRAADPGIDIAPLLQLLSGGDRRQAGLALGAWLVSEEGRAFLAPLMLDALALLDRLLPRRRRR
ncbi:MAG TPA: hypothetical protein ENJ94_04390 [Gammaproteobacteria bacterium]|nr:hypothetical protein [Gammaproteobacteria bacterium]